MTIFEKQEVKRLLDSGMGYKSIANQLSGIAKQLTEDGIPTPGGKTKWHSSTVDSILQNEKYKGDALLQKQFTVDFLSKKRKTNEGEVPQYYVTGSHPAIISPDLFDLVQAEITRRKAIRLRYSGGSIFATKIICGDCGCFFGHKAWHSSDKYKRLVWQCKNKYNSEKHCCTPHLYDDEIKEMFIEAYNALLTDKERLIEDCRLIQLQLSETGPLENELSALKSELELIGAMIKQLIAENATHTMDQAEYAKQYEQRVKHYDTVKLRMNTLLLRQKNKLAKAEAIGAFMFELMERSDVLTEFDEELWQVSVANVTVKCDNTVVFKFHNGTEYTAKKRKKRGFTHKMIQT